MLKLELAPATLPDGERVYAVGDVHGCAGRLRALHVRIAEDLAARPIGAATLIHLGDYIDRGPDSAGVVAILLAPWPGERPPLRINLTGNHEAMMLRALAGPEPRDVSLWIDNGGDASLRSWRIDGEVPARLWSDRVPPEHLGFLRALRLMHRAGGYAFVHAGIRPGRAIEHQRRDDLLWIREPFLSWPGPFPCVIVHGHTPSETPEVRANRIGIDTGAVLGGPLTCAVLESDRIGFLEA